MRYTDLDRLEFNQNTIDDFYESTIDMLNDLLDLVCVKILDNIKCGELYTKERLLEIIGFSIRYIKGIAKGYDFQGEH